MPCKLQAEEWWLLAGVPYGLGNDRSSKSRVRGGAFNFSVKMTKYSRTNFPLYNTEVKKKKNEEVLYKSFLLLSVCRFILVQEQHTCCPCRFPSRWGSDRFLVGDLGLLPTGFSIGSIKIKGKTLLKLLQLNLPWGFDFKVL